MPSTREVGAFFEEHNDTIAWSLLALVVGALGWEAVRRYLDKSAATQVTHRYDTLDSRERFQLLMAKKEEIPHY